MADLHLVTGGCGYFGSVLVEQLRARGAAVRVFDLATPDAPAAGVEYVQGDIRTAEAVRRACAGVSVVHHNVAQVPLARDPALFWSVNCDGTAVLLDAARDAGVRKLVYTSSSAVLGVPEHNPVDEHAEPRPQEEYGRAKLAGEELCRAAASHGQDVSIVRPRTILGPGRLGIMQVLFEWIRLGRAVPVFGGGANRYQFVHADDLAQACLAAAGKRGPGLYHVGAEQFGTLRETLEGLIRHAGTGSRVVSVPRRPTELAMRIAGNLGLAPLAPYHAIMYGRSMFFDLARAKRELGYVSKHSNIDLFCLAYDWYVENRERVLARRGASTHRSVVKHGVLEVASRVLSAWPG